MMQYMALKVFAIFWVAMSKGGFTGNGVFGAIPYLVVEYGDGTQKQCTFKREDHVDDLLAYLAKVCPGLPLHSVQAEQRLARKAQEEAVRYLDVLTPEAQAAREKLEKARTFLAGYPKLTDRLSTAAKAKRVNEHTNPAHKWVALAIVLAGAAALDVLVSRAIVAIHVPAAIVAMTGATTTIPARSVAAATVVVAAATRPVPVAAAPAVAITVAAMATAVAASAAAAPVAPVTAAASASNIHIAR